MDYANVKAKMVSNVSFKIITVKHVLIKPFTLFFQAEQFISSLFCEDREVSYQV